MTLKFKKDCCETEITVLQLKNLLGYMISLTIVFLVPSKKTKLPSPLCFQCLVRIPSNNIIEFASKIGLLPQNWIQFYVGSSLTLHRSNISPIGTHSSELKWHPPSSILHDSLLQEKLYKSISISYLSLTLIRIYVRMKWNNIYIIINTTILQG